MPSIIDRVRGDCSCGDSNKNLRRSDRRPDRRRRQRSYSSCSDEESESYVSTSDFSPSPRPPPEAAMGRQEGEQVTEDYQLQDEKAAITPEEAANAHYKQNYAPFSTMFCIVQTVILIVMSLQCGIAPLKINPMIGPYPDALNYWGAKNAVLIIVDGEVWRLFTPIFLHAGLIHLVGNVMVQIDAGNEWEKEWGSIAWLIVYIGSAFGSSVFSCIFMPDNISVGSSGAVMGLFGGKLSEIMLLCCEKGKTPEEIAGQRSRNQQACLVVGGIVIVAAMSFIPYVDWAAHLGGMIAGFVIGLTLFSCKISNWLCKLIWFAIGAAITLVLYSIGMAYMYTMVETKEELRDVCGYYQQYFEDYECKCMLDEAIEFGSWQFGGNNNGGDSGD